MYGDDSGYELNDPKHPTFHERYADWGDSLRKREREDAPIILTDVDPGDESDAA
jgi:hypothetical protein